MTKAFKYRLYPSKSKKRLLNNTLRICRELYNETLENKNVLFEQMNESIGGLQKSLIILTNIGSGYVVPGVSVEICIAKTTVSMFAWNVDAVIILTKEVKRRLWMVSYERRNKWTKLLYDGKLFQPCMVGKVVKEKHEEKGKAIFQENQIIPSFSFQTD